MAAPSCGNELLLKELMQCLFALKHALEHQCRHNLSFILYHFACEAAVEVQLLWRGEATEYSTIEIMTGNTVRASLPESTMRVDC